MKEKTCFEGIGAKNSTEGCFEAKLSVYGELFCVKFHVVDNTLMKHGVLIGADFLNKVDLRSVRRQVTIAPPPKEITAENHYVPEVFKIDIFEKKGALDYSHISNTDGRIKVESLVENYKPVKSREVNVKMKIILKDDTPAYQRPRRLSPSEKNEVDKQIREWLKDGIIKPSSSEYASPVVLVKKKNGETRICVYFRKLNKLIIKDRYPLPLIEDQLDLLQGATIFTALDLKNGFFHVEVDKESQKYLSFVVPGGQYEFAKVPFGLCNSPAVFQEFINAVFKDLIAKGIVLTYMDDSIIPSHNIEQAVESLADVLEVACQAGLQISWKKCQFLFTKIEYLGHIVENGTVRLSEYKTKAVMKFPIPKNIKDVQNFLGLTGYFRKFIKEYSMIARPLTNLLKNGVEFTFDFNQQHAFNELKNALINQPMLKLYKTGAET